MDSSFYTSDCKYSDTRQRRLLTSSFPQVTLVWRWQRTSLPSRGAGQPGMYKKGWVPCQLPTLQWKGLVKFQLWGFPSTPITILVRESKGPSRKGRTEKAAPMSKRKFTSLPSICRVTQGSRGVIWISPFTVVSQATWHYQSRSPRTNTEGAGVGVSIHLPLRVMWTLPFPMPILSAVGTLRASQPWWISKILFFPCSPHDSCIVAG